MASSMRTWFLVVCLGLLMVGCGDKNKLNEKLWGEWIGQGGVTMDFSASGLVHMQTPDGKTTDGDYVADFSQEPYKLDISLRDGKKILTIFRFDVEGRLVLQSTATNRARPEEFDNGAVFFTRKAPEASPSAQS